MAALAALFGRRRSTTDDEKRVVENRIPDEVTQLRTFFNSQSSLGYSSFMIGDTLGTGTFGRVRLVQMQYQSDYHSFALKMLKKSEILRLKQLEHIKSEKEILTAINHPFIVNLYKTFQDDRFVYMVMEYVIGGEMFSLLRREGRFSNEKARFYAAEIVSALEYLHNQNIIYRDLKPENLLIDRDGHIKITDFGFAKRVEDRTWTLCGTPEYLAPEIIQSKGHNKGVDWWALGILIFEMLAGYPPFFDENAYGIYQKILLGRIDFPRTIDPDAKDLIRKLLTSDRTKRYGCLRNGAGDIKSHKWFRGIDWDAVSNRQLSPPYVPPVVSDDDTANFDKYPDSEEEAPIPDTVHQETFRDF
eukprot:TRINITY_DN14900_c0_g1_i5.p1 TRINITY_DN14900_c0_g1~~TRINITY_DN14900_c0_g1_i5.p1  ORF type:complete len:359 (+),score=86.70 TRINITY_DN14900_c0_g1_i5:179-1255(+)